MYIKKLKETLDKVDFSNLNKIVDAIQNSKSIAIIGNGGSASTAEHMACDLNLLGYNATSLNSISTITAFANDYDFDEIYMRQIENLKPDVLIAISASGNSPNIIKATSILNIVCMTTIAFCGFDGGQLKSNVDFNIHVPINNYEIVEDIHLIISHMIKCELIKRKQ